MDRLGTVAEKIRSKNAGPFCLTIDIFCGSAEAYARVVRGLATAQVAVALGTNGEALRRFDMPDLQVVKFSLPRPEVQGSIRDRDMHGASWAALLAELEI
ncbi:MAG: DUF4387 family protein [Pseudomonadota bacterium]